MPFFSIIVPVYNVEEYLDECVNSVLCQTFSDFELILVDDGSPDSCPQMCDNFSEKDSRVKVIHKENGGASSSRNFGIKVANGSYILFLDSDDYWSDINALQILHDNIIIHNHADVMIFGCTDFNTETGQVIVTRSGYDLELIEKGDVSITLHYLLSNKLLPGGPTIFAVSSDLLQNIRFLFKTDIQNEDFDYVLSVFCNAKSLYAINNPFYMYRKGRSSSVTGASSIKMIYGIDYTLDKWLPICNAIENKMKREDVLNYLAFIYTTGFVIYGRLKKEDKIEAVKIIRKHKDILKYGYWRKTKIIRFADRILGDRLFSILAKLYFEKTHI